MNPLDRLRGIIARDIDGRPLRVGDRVVVVNAAPRKHNGEVHTVIGRHQSRERPKCTSWASSGLLSTT